MVQSLAHVRLDLTESTAQLTLNRPPLNILTLEMIGELHTALDTVAEHPHLKIVTVAAAGATFCAGVDVADHAAARAEPTIRAFNRLCARLRSLPVPTLAVVRGRALGGGTELAVACDLVLAGASAVFGQPEIKVGVFPPVAAALLSRLIGYQRAARLVLTGEPVGADEALRLGLVTWMVPDDEVLAALARVIDQFKGLSAASLGITKIALRLGADADFAEALPRVEALYLDDLMATADAQEGIAAYLEKRRPVWRDR